MSKNIALNLASGQPDPKKPVNLVDQILDVVESLLARVRAIEVHTPIVGPQGESGKPGTDGKDGKDADPALVAQLVSDAVAKIPVPKDGRDGRDGTAGKDAEPAKPGVDGKDGRDGKDGKDADPALVAQLVSDAVAKIPVPKDGRDGRDGLAGRSIVSAKIEEEILVLTYTDGSSERVGNIVGPAGKDGSDGKHGEPGAKGDPGQSIAGKPGRDGKDGTAGEPGPAAVIELSEPYSAEIDAKGLRNLSARDLTINGQTYQIICRN